MIGESMYHNSQDNNYYSTGCIRDIHQAISLIDMFNSLYYFDFAVEFKRIKQPILDVIKMIIDTYSDTYLKLISVLKTKKVMYYDELKQIIGEEHENSIKIHYYETTVEYIKQTIYKEVSGATDDAKNYKKHNKVIKTLGFDHHILKKEDRIKKINKINNKTKKADINMFDDDFSDFDD